MKTVAFLTFVVLVLTASAQNCSNPLITRSGWWGNLVVETAPIDYTPDMSVCAAAGIADAGQSCCSSEFFSQLNTAWSKARAEVEVGVNSFEDMNTMYREGISEAKQAIDNDSELTSKQKADLRKLIDSVASILSEFVDKFPSSYARCANYILKYQAGVACFWCNPNWGDYVSANGENKFNFHVAQSNCDRFSENCVDMVLLISKMFNRVMQLASEMGDFDSDYSEASGAEADDFSLFDNCLDTASCKSTICSSNFMSGTGGSFIAGDDSSYDAWTGRSVRNVALQKVDQILRPVLRTIRQQQVQIENVYTNNGYRAMEVGTATGLSTEISSASSVSSWLALF